MEWIDVVYEYDVMIVLYLDRTIIAKWLKLWRRERTQLDENAEWNKISCFEVDWFFFLYKTHTHAFNGRGQQFVRNI